MLVSEMDFLASSKEREARLRLVTVTVELLESVLSCSRLLVRNTTRSGFHDSTPEDELRLVGRPPALRKPSLLSDSSMMGVRILCRPLCLLILPVDEPIVIELVEFHVASSYFYLDSIILNIAEKCITFVQKCCIMHINAVHATLQ